MSRPGPARIQSEYQLFRAFRGLAALLPYDRRPAFGASLMRTLLRNSSRLSARIDNNLRLVMPSLDAAARLEIRDATAENFGRTFTEILNNREFHARGGWLAPEDSEGIDALRASAENGKGVILVSGHFGQWEAVRAWLRDIGTPASAIYRALDNPKINAEYVAGLEAAGAPVFPKSGRGIRGMVGHVARGGVVAILADQYQHRAAPLDFIGRPAPTALLPAELALKFDLPMIPVYGIRQPDAAHVQVVVEPPVPRGSASEMMQAANNSLAGRVLAHPGQYYWLHRRWTKDLPARIRS